MVGDVRGHVIISVGSTNETKIQMVFIIRNALVSGPSPDSDFKTTFDLHVLSIEHQLGFDLQLNSIVESLLSLQQ